MKYLLEDELEKDLINGVPRNREIISPVVRAQSSIKESGFDNRSARALLHKFLDICNKWKNKHGEPVSEIHKTLVENLLDSEHNIDDSPPYHCAGPTVISFADIIFQKLLSEDSDKHIKNLFLSLVEESSLETILQLTILYHAANNEIYASQRCYELLQDVNKKIVDFHNKELLNKLMPIEKGRELGGKHARLKVSKKTQDVCYELFESLQKRGTPEKNWPGIASEKNICSVDTARKYRTKFLEEKYD